MVELAEFLDPQPSRLWHLLPQVGVTRVVSSLGDKRRRWGADAPWNYLPLLRAKHAYEDHGFELVAIEDSPPLDRVRLGLDGREQELEWFCELVRTMGRLGVPVLCWNWIAAVPWLRTRVAVPGRGGALVTAFDAADLEHAPPTPYGAVEERRMWEAFDWFMERVLPVAEDAGVRLALHPDDPPIASVRGVARIVYSLDAYEYIFERWPSEANAMTLCQGNVALMTDDLPAAIRRFGAAGRIAFGHFRDVRGTPERFVETFHDEGPTDMLACMRAWHEIGFDGVLRPDHVPTLAGESNDQPGYAELGRLHAIGYMTGLREAVRDERAA